MAINQKELNWVLKEWDCHDLEQAKEEAKQDKALHLALRHVGVTFEKEKQNGVLV